MWLSSVKGSRKEKKTFLFIYCGRKSMQVLYIELLAFFFLKYLNFLFSLVESKPIMLRIQLQTPVCCFSLNKRQTRGFGWMRQTRREEHG